MKSKSTLSVFANKRSWLSVLQVDHAQQVFQMMPNQSKMRTGVLNGEKINVSSEDEMTFDRTDDLKMYVAKHSREKTHTCVQCQRLFDQAGNRNAHMPTRCGVVKTERNHLVIQEL